MCDKFDNIGFLSHELDDLQLRLKQLYPDYTKWLLNTNQFCHELQYKLCIVNNSPDHLVASTLYARIVSTYQAFILICERGMDHQAKMLLRCLIECVFQLVAVSKNKDYSRKIIGSEQHQHQRKRMLKNLIRFHNRHHRNHPDLGKIQQDLIQVENNISQNKLKKLTTCQIAVDAGLEDWYDVVYSALCDTVHASIRFTEEHLAVNGNKIRAIKNEPNINDFGHLFLSALQAMAYSGQAIASVLGVESVSFLKELDKAIKKLGEAEGKSDRGNI